MQGEIHSAVPATGDLNLFPAVRGQGGCSGVGQSCVQFRQFEAPLSAGVKVPAAGSFVKEPYSFTEVTWAVHSVSSSVAWVVSRQAC